MTRNATPCDARRAALESLQLILKAGQLPEQALNQQPLKQAQERAFARRLVLLVLRRYGQINATLENLLTQNDTALKVKLLLALGMVQLWESEVPDHAAISTSVDLAHALGLQPKLVNAILRRVQREETDYRQQNVLLNLPEHWQQQWGKLYPLQALAEAITQEPPVDLWTKGDVAKTAEVLQAQPLFGHSLRLGKGEITKLDGFDEGDWWVQDVAAALPAQCLGDMRGKSVLEIGAAPGGKTMQLAAAGARVTALDASAKRMKRLEANLERTGLSAECVVTDARSFEPQTLPDAVLIDAPCSATGTLRRHPEILQGKTLADVQEMAALQQAILQQISRWLPAGVPVVYATCSLEPEEGEAQIARWLEDDSRLKRLPLSAEETGWPQEWFTPQGDIRTLPCFMAEQGGMDGFFIARLIRQ
jgi:16S rRNA (cytosine967-C5)-methyltransferase